MRESARRDRLVKELSSKGIASPAVLEAMRTVPRERFVEEALRGEAYNDVALPIGEKQTISQPWIVARMCELAYDGGRGRVLEIGTGSGYHAAVLSHLFERVYTVERIAALSRLARTRIRGLGIETVHFKIFDGSYGWSEFAPYDAAVVTAAVPEIPTPLLTQMAEGGRLVLPLAEGGPDYQVLVRIMKKGDGMVREDHGGCRFVPLVGRYGMVGGEAG